jgi:hypothetical protein
MTVLTFGAPPCDASDTPQATTPKASEKRSLSASAAAHVAALAPTPRALAQDPTAAAAASTGGSRSFFQTRTGIAAIVLMVAGAAYVGYSIPKDNEKVHSPIR